MNKIYARLKAPVVIAALFILYTNGLYAIPWPVKPTSPTHEIGNSYGEFQNYGGDSYLHPGLDVLVPDGTPVYAVRSGWVKAVMTTHAELHWRAAIGDSPGTEECEGWLYAHLDQSTIAVAEGDYVEEGDYLGEIVYWPGYDFHHIHFVKIRNSGQPWASDWEFIANPLDELEGIIDLFPPTVRPCYGEYKFAFFENGTHIYFSPGAPVSGDVDILARLHDINNSPSWGLAPYSISYEIYNDTLTTGLIHSLTFTGRLLDEIVSVTYQRDAEFYTQGNYSMRDFYFIITNTDGDSVIEISDTTGCWRTADFDNGDYWVKIFVHDRDDLEITDNLTIDSMQVTVYNTHPCDCADLGDLDLNGTIDPLDVAILVNYVYLSLDSRVQLPDCPAENGDWDCTGTVDPLDVTYCVNYVYRSSGQGPCDPCSP